MVFWKDGVLVDDSVEESGVEVTTTLVTVDGRVTATTTAQEHIERFHCEKCKHERCGVCQAVCFNMAQIEGVVCCQCGHRSSLETWRSGKRFGYVG